MNGPGQWCGRVLSSQDLSEVTSDCKVLRIAFSSADEVRSRRVVTRSRARPTGKYPSWKMGRMLQWESINELHAFRLLDCDPNVTAFTEQPCEIVYLDGTELRRHYPDIYVEMNGYQELWEVKAESKIAQIETSARTDLLSRELRQYGFTYRVVLDRELARQPRLRNAETLLRFGRRPISDCEREAVRLALRGKGHLTWIEACQGAFGIHGREFLCRLVLEGILRFDMDAPLSPATHFDWKEE